MEKWSYRSSILDIGTRRKWSALRYGYFTPGEIIPPGIHCTGGWVGLRAGLGPVEKRKLLPLLGIEPRPSNPSLYQLSYPGSFIPVME
jgi:hypothetical protein